MSSLTQRMLGAARLNTAIFEEVEADRTATPQALIVVVLASVAMGIGGMYFGGLGLVLTGILGAVLGWALWAALIWLIGTKILPEAGTNSDWGEIARTTGFAQAPGLLRFFGFVPVIGPFIVIIATIWMLIAMIIAVRQALDYTQTWRAVVVVLIGWLINLAVIGVLGHFN